MINDDLLKRSNRSTRPDDVANLPSRIGRVSEVVKSMFVWELRHLFGNSEDNTGHIPYIEKFNTLLPNRDLDPLETVVRIIRQYSNITERLPYIGVALTAGRSNKLAFGTKYVDRVMSLPRCVAGTVPVPPLDEDEEPLTPPVWSVAVQSNDFLDNNQPGLPADWPEPIGDTRYGLDDGDFVEFTTVLNGVEYVSRIIFTRKLLGRSPQTPRTIADIINLQALYCHADVVFKNEIPTLIVEPGGPGGSGSVMSIQRSDASANFDNYIRFDNLVRSAPSDEFPAANRYLNSLNMTVSLVVGTEGDTVRTELTDLLLEFFNIIMDDRQYTFWGRSINSDIPDEVYQLIISDKEIALAGEQEIPRPDDPSRKVYINRLNIPILMMQYADRRIQVGVVAEEDESLPEKN